ncbi:MAG: hypothetical protein Q9195_001521 [Heterodermia aff. obscurata]
MATYSPRLLGLTADFHQPFGAKPSRDRPDRKNASDEDTNESSADEIYDGSNYFKSAQWSPDGTTIVTSSADNALRSFILPTDLFTSSTPHALEPYTTHSAPDPTFATAFYPLFSLQNPASTLFLASLRSLPIRLYSPFALSKIASYPLVSPTTEAFIAPHSLLFSTENPNHFFAGSESCVSSFDIQRDGEGPVSRMHTTTSRRSSTGTGIKGIVSALGMSADGVLAAGTFTRSVGLYDDHGNGGTVAVFPLQSDHDRESAEEGVGRGAGITQLLWSECSRYLCVVERGSDGVGVWDIRGAGRRLAWLRGRKACTPQRLSAEVVGHEVWAGGTDGCVRVWEGLGTGEGIVDSVWQFRAHDDAVCATTFHASGSVLATASGQHHFQHRRRHSTGEESDEDEKETYDNSLKLWAL